MNLSIFLHTLLCHVFFKKLSPKDMCIDYKRGRERDRQTDMWIGCLPHMSRQGIETHNLGMCPDQESNPQFFVCGTPAPTRWATRPGRVPCALKLWRCVPFEHCCPLMIWPLQYYEINFIPRSIYCSEIYFVWWQWSHFSFLWACSMVYIFCIILLLTCSCLYI